MLAHRIETTIGHDRTLTLENLPFPSGESVEVIILSRSNAELESPQKLVLTDRDRDLFLELMVNPPEPNKTLVQAMRRFQDEYEDE